jgi:hypothetical protein
MTVLPKFTFRREDDGFIVHVPDTGRYFHANPAAEQSLAQLQRGERQMNAPHLEALTAVLRGDQERLVAADNSDPQLVPLSDLMGSSADRCETFGMPL